jgi:hypothetical protein
MSGPITAVVLIEPVTVGILALGIRAAIAVRDAYAEAAQLRQQHGSESEAILQQQRQATLANQASLAAANIAAQARFDQLLTLAQELGLAQQVQDCRPAANEGSAQAKHVAALEALNNELETLLRYEVARRQGDTTMPELTLPQGLTHPTEPIQPAPEDSQTTAQRLLARIEPLGPVPQDIAELALTLAATPPGERANLLATELRHQIQKHIESIGQRLAHEAAAVVVEQALKDLGYQVDEIGNTLFVEGGVVHFRRQSWGNYMVRMRINAKGSEANFNVIRAVTANENEKSVLDHIAEDRWCTEFPALMQTLAARGVHLNVTRRLAAGELPVQLVNASKLPQFTDDEQTQTQQPLQTERARPIK